MSFTELHQMLKLPLLVQHFMHHKAAEPNTTLWDFLKNHYQNQQPFDKDYDRDMKLPFKTMAECQSMSISTLPPMGVECPEYLPKIVEKQTYTLLDQSLLPFYLANIWQPPRNC